MDAYIEFALLADDEFPQHLLMDAFCAKLHRALVEDGVNTIGISFPGWRRGDYPTLGNAIRLHGTDADLSALMQRDWLRGMRDHLRTEGPSPVPTPHGYLLVQRRKTKSAENMRKRAMRRHGLTAEQAADRIPYDAGDSVDLPYTTQLSRSTGQRYRIFVDQREATSSGSDGFNSQGLSAGSAVPSF